jgi:hypothetical protein
MGKWDRTGGFRGELRGSRCVLRDFRECNGGSMPYDEHLRLAGGTPALPGYAFLYFRSLLWLLFFYAFAAAARGRRRKPFWNNKRQTMSKASRTILPVILEVPRKRSVKMIGVSTTFMP